MWAVKCVLLLITLFQGTSHIVKCETLHMCSNSSQQVSCQTLSQFAIANNQTNYTRSNTTLIFKGGNHTLVTGIIVSNVIAFSMLSENSSIAVVNCCEGANMTLTNVSKVYIRGLIFIGCGGSTVNSARLLKIEEVQFYGKSSSASSILISESNASIIGTHFLLNEHGSYRSDIEYFRLFPFLNGSVTTVGGALIITNSTLFIDKCQFDNNSAKLGGALFVESESKVIIKNSNFTFNQATGCQELNSYERCLGGALYIGGKSRVDITYDTIFENNTSDQNGGIIYASKAALTILNSHISNNFASNNGGALYAHSLTKLTLNATKFESNRAHKDGGAMYLDNLEHDALVSDCNLMQNRADGNGGAIFNLDSNVQIDNSYLAFSSAGSNGGALINEKFSKTSVFNSTFRFNSATNDGGVIHTSDRCKFIDSILINNTAINHGGVVYAHQLSFSPNIVQNSSFQHNWANIGGVFCIKTGASIHVDSSKFDGSINVETGAVIFACVRAHVRLSMSTFTNNSALYGGVLTTMKENNILIEDCEFINNTALNSGGTIYARSGSTLVISNSSFMKNKVTDNGIVHISDSTTLMAKHSSFIENVASHDGGAVHLNDDSIVCIHYCIFDNNRADNSGGAIYGRNNGSITVSFTSMNNNLAQTSGGGIHAQKNCRVIIESSDFTNNTADYGGVIHAYVSSTVKISVSSFMGNFAKIAGGALATYKSSNITVEKCYFISNIAAGVGGVSVAIRDACNHLITELSVCGDVKIKENTITFIESGFFYNKAYRTGVLYAQGSIINVTNSAFHNNCAENLGGGIFATEESIITIYATKFIANEVKNKGGVVALTSNSKVNITNSNFTGSRAHKDGGVIYLRWSNASIHSSHFTSSISHRNGGVLAVTNGSVNIENSSFSNNNAYQSGGVLHLSSKSNLIITCSVFIGNGAKFSGGILHQKELSKCTIIDSVFLYNRATQSGGALSSSLSFINIIKSSFNGNSASKGAALSITQKSSMLLKSIQEDHILHNNNIIMLACNKCCDAYSIFNGSALELFFGTETYFTSNRANETGGAIHIEDSFVKIETKVYIGHNQAASGGGIYAVKSSISFGSSIHFQENWAVDNGGGISLTKSVLNSTNKTATVKFESNRATLGGGIYTEDKTEHSICANDPALREFNNSSGCFFQHATKYLTMLFIANQARKGHDLFGGLLDRCTVTSDAKPFLLESIIASGTSQFKEISNLTSYDTVSSEPVRLCPCERNVTNPNCSQQTHKVNVMMKNSFFIRIAAVDQVNHTIPATIISEFEGLNLTESQTMKRIGPECHELKYHVAFPTVNTYKLFMYPDGPCADKGISRLNISVNVMSCTCPPGFMQKENIDTKCACVCDKFISNYIEKCDQVNKTVIRKGSFWITYLNRSTYSAKSVSPYFIYPYCPLNYCQPPSIPIHINFSQPNGSDAQCVNNRGGFLCGGCLPQYSLSFGSSRCITCPKHWYGLPVGIFLGTLLAGLLLVFLVLVLNLTVAVGTLNALIFYANIIDANKSTYFGQETQIKFFPMFISWLNLNIGFDIIMLF